MNQMNVAGINPGVGGPVGGIPMMSNGSTAPRNDANVSNGPDNMDESIKLNTEPSTKPSPGQRRDGEVNGVDGDVDIKDADKLKMPDDLPRPNLPSESQQSSFLLDWFSLFWDFFWAQHKKGNSSDVRQYHQYTQHMMRLKEQQQNQLFRQQPIMPAQMGQIPMRRNPMVPNLQKTVLQNNTPGLSQQQLVQFQKNQAMMQHMQREHSDMDINGHRPQSPASGENAPSPSKRPRLEGAHMNGQQMAPNMRGQGQGLPGQPNPQALLMQNGMNARGINPQFPAFQQSGPASAQQKSIQVYAQNQALHHFRSALNNQGIPNGLMNAGVMPNQTDLVPMPDGQGMYPMGDYYGANGQQLAQLRAGMQTPGGQHGNHALQDYQMQLMLLEQQNKRRLLMARQEQDSITRDGQPPVPGQPPMPAGAMQGGRTGTSPNPNDQIKRGTPKLPQAGLPGSPSAGEPMAQNRGSPAGMNFNGSQMPPEIPGHFFVKGMPEGMVGANGMRPPSSNPAFSGPQMNQPIPAPGNRVPGGNWQSQQGPQVQPMPPQQSPVNPPQPGGTPQERNAMPPPQAPPVGVANAGRASPQTGTAAPPTPQQANKPAPKKKETKDGRKRSTKKGTAAAAAAAAAPANANAAATPSSEAEPPPTPTPSTPITPQHPNSFNKTGPNATTSAPQQPTSAPAPQPLVQQPPDQSQSNFNDLSIPDAPAFNLDFAALDNPDILENFDFDSFLNTDADTTEFGFDPTINYPSGGVETGAGDGL